jgi:hypothetical protein
MKIEGWSRILVVAFGFASATPSAFCQQAQPEWRRLLKASESEQVAWINSQLRAGMPPSEAFGDLMLNRSHISLPLIEAKIEEVLRSSSPSDCFDDKSVEPQRFVGYAALAIANVGDAQALKELSKLIRIDERRFGGLVEDTLLHARSYGNPFVVAYQGLDLRDPTLDGRIAAWAEFMLAERRPPFRNYGRRDPEPVPESEVKQVRSMWADAMADRYKRVPTETEWALDPLVSRLESIRARVLRDTMIPAVAEALQKHQKR